MGLKVFYYTVIFMLAFAATYFLGEGAEEKKSSELCRITVSKDSYTVECPLEEFKRTCKFTEGKLTCVVKPKTKF